MSGDGNTGLEFRDLRETRDPGLLEAVYRDLFLPHFPDPDEQEEPHDWIPRLWEAPRPPEPEQHGVVAGTHLNDAAARSLAGFAFVERYRRSQCALLSYIAVDRSWRRRRLARTLFDRALESARQAAIADGGPLRAVFAEIHDPQRVGKANDVIDPAERVRIMAHLGARLVPIHYVQPALREGRDPSDRLLLIAFPQHGEDVLDSGVVREFLREYYAAQAVPEPADDPGLIRISGELGEGPIELVRLPDIYRTEEPSLKFRIFGVALHFVARTKKRPKQLQQQQQQPMEFVSFEQDLFSYSYVAERRHNTPFASQIVSGVVSAPKTVWLSVPVRICCESEGKRIELRVKRSPDEDHRRREFAVKASRTDFQDGVSVFHLVFVSTRKPDSVLDEYDLVALSKLWQGGEGWTDAEEIRFDWEGSGGGKSVTDLAQAVFGDSPLLYPDWEKRRVRCGTIQLITSESALGVEWNAIWPSVLALRSDRQPRTYQHLDQVKGLGGIVQGLLDFREIDPDELADVFAAFEIDDSSLLGLHKGTIVSIAESDRVYKSMRATIGVSPYLLLPQAVLLHNEELLEEAERRQLAADEHPGVLEESLDVMRSALADYLPNVFHYPQERRLLLRGEASRGLHGRRMQLIEQTAKLEARWEQGVAKRRTLADDIRNTLLLLLAGFTIYPEVNGTFWERAFLVGLGVAAVLLLVYSRPWARRLYVSLKRRLRAEDGVDQLTSDGTAPSKAV